MTGLSQKQKHATEAPVRVHVGGLAGVPDAAPALTALWADRGARGAWAVALVHAGAHKLGGGTWLIEHPPGWADAERRAAAEEARRLTGTWPDFVADPALTAGLRLRVGAALLDATPEALAGRDGRMSAVLAGELRRVNGEV
jgi:hypothetical protein